MGIQRLFFWMLTLLALSLAALPALAQNDPPPKIALNVDRDPLVANDPFVLTIRVETTSGDDPEVQIPTFGRLQVLQQSQSSSVSSQFTLSFGSGRNSQTTRATDYNIVLRAPAPGKYTINPVVVIANGKRFSSSPRTLQVVGDGATSAPPLPPGTPSPGIPDGTQDEVPSSDTPPTVDGSLDGAKFDANYFLQAHVDKKECVVGEPLVLTLYLYTSVNIADINVSREPGTEGFWVENALPANRRFTTERVIVGNREFERGILRKLILFPIKPGTLTIAPAMADIVVRSGSFFSAPKTVKRSAIPVQIRAVALPKENQPQGASVNNVGQFSFAASTDRTAVNVGEPITLSLTVSGIGNLRNVDLPSIPSMAGLKIYDPEIETDVQVQGDGVTGKKTSKILIIPSAPGTYPLASLVFHYFDPIARKYQSIESPSISLTVGGTANVSPTQVATTATPTTQGQDRLNRQLRSIQSRAKLDRSSSAPPYRNPLYLLLLVIFPLIYVSLISVAKAKKWRTDGQAGSRVKGAEGVAQKRMNAIGAKVSSARLEEFYSDLAGVLIRFLEDRLEAPVLGDTHNEMKKRLTQRGFSEDQAGKVLSELEACDFARFAKSAGISDERDIALKRMQALIQELAQVKVTKPEEKN